MKYKDLFKFITQSEVDSFKKAIESGFDINDTDEFGFSLLHRACVNHSPEIAEFLLIKGANTSLIATNNWTALHTAAVSGAVNCISILVNAGADVDAQDVNGCTALHLSVTSRNPQVASVLIDHGASKSITNNRGITPMGTARSKNRESFYDILG